MTSVTHIGGPVMTIGQRKIQRCPVCGEKLVDNIDYLRGRVASPDGPPVCGFWPEGELVQVDGNRSSVIKHVDGEQLPEDACPRQRRTGESMTTKYILELEAGVWAARVIRADLLAENESLRSENEELRKSRKKFIDEVLESLKTIDPSFSETHIWFQILERLEAEANK